MRATGTPVGLVIGSRGGCTQSKWSTAVPKSSTQSTQEYEWSTNRHLGDQIAHFGDQIAHLGDQLVPTVEYIYIRKVMVAPTARSDSLFGKSPHEEGDEVRQSLTLDVASTCTGDELRQEVDEN